ncbi:SixA phosphatase family protein [Nocardioides mesophilus]|uniref:Histidine phosphatase family protein n=1 Tax=Nocardioides mesophilus TaxID=433659 RepID=A0A7G9RB91_9ACTN|nr:histidine phosphatase family protein [Nocardioides mesophilus]QNN52866.1 histidine phosphatase family protein [Nocardioides mesophilus]
MTERRLIVMRHAKAEPFAADDQDRRLSERGVLDAAAAGRHLAATQLVPDHAVVSPAVRTRMTWDEVCRASGSSASVSFDDAIYHGDTEAALETLQSVPGQARTVILVGHNPTASYLCHLLDDGAGDVDATSGLMGGFPTSALAVFDVEVPWLELGAETGRLVGFHVGHG